MSSANWSNFSNFSELPAKANEASNNTFWPGMIVMLWVILILTMIGFGWEVSVMVASFIMLILSILLTYAGLINWAYIAFFASIIIFEFIYVIYTKSKQSQ